MQAPKTALPDMESKDKFLVQSTAVSSETTDADITSSMFAKDGDKYVEEKKLRVSFISLSDSPNFSPIKVDLKQGQGHEALMLNDPVFGGVETLPPHKMVMKDAKFRAVNSEESKPSKETEAKPAEHVELKLRKEEELKPVKSEELEAIKVGESKSTYAVPMEPAKDVEFRSAKVVELDPAKDMELNYAKTLEMKPSEDFLLKRSKDVEADKAQVVEDMKLVKDIEELKSKLLELELKLSQAEVTISKLTEERSSSIQEIKDLKEQLVISQTLSYILWFVN